MKFRTGQITATVLLYIKKNCCENIVKFYPWLQIALIVPARLTTHRLCCQSRNSVLLWCITEDYVCLIDPIMEYKYNHY